MMNKNCTERRYVSQKLDCDTHPEQINMSKYFFTGFWYHIALN